MHNKQLAALREARRPRRRDYFHGARPRLITATDAENGRIHFPFLNYKNKSEPMTSFSLNESH